jgi:hypothetical protein
MRRSAILFTVAAMMIATGANAQSRASFSACEQLSEQRASGIGGGNRTHNQFMRDCLEGKIPFTTGTTGTTGRTPAPARVGQVQMQSYEKCEALAEQRGAGSAWGDRNHRSFMSQCMAGKIR